MSMIGRGLRARSLRPRTNLMLACKFPGTTLVTVEQDTGDTAVSVMYDGEVNQASASNGHEMAVFV